MSPYRDPLKTYIHALKYEGNTRIAQTLGILLAEAYQRYGLHADVIIPIPLHKERQRQRGYNQAQLLAEACAAILHIPCRPELLIRTRETTIQAQLLYKERQHNMENAFACTSPEVLRQKNILLIDDVCTTGATMEACTMPLLAGKARAIQGLVLARPL